MPMYDYFCEECHQVQSVFKRIADLDKPELCPCGKPMQRLISAPMVQTDYPGYSCPITGEWIEGRRAHLENLKKHGCRLAEKGEDEAYQRSLAQEDAAFEASISRTFEAEVARLPARKRERLAAEMEAGLDVSVVRQ